MSLQAFADAVLAHALSLPEAWEDDPWGERVVKVRKKVFLFSGFNEAGDRFSMSVKLPESAVDVLACAHATPTGYGLGRHGWVSLSFETGEETPLDEARAMVDESYRAIAPKTLARRMAEAG